MIDSTTLTALFCDVVVVDKLRWRSEVASFELWSFGMLTNQWIDCSVSEYFGDQTSVVNVQIIKMCMSVSGILDVQTCRAMLSITMELLNVHLSLRRRDHTIAVL